MKKLFAVILSAILLLSSASALAEPYRVAIVQPMSHTSLDQIRDTIVKQLEFSGRDIEIVLGNANGDTAALAPS